MPLDPVNRAVGSEEGVTRADGFTAEDVPLVQLTYEALTVGDNHLGL